MVTIGTVRYLNALPLHRYLDREKYKVVADHPSVIARMLALGAVDVALVPVGAILADGMDVRIAPGWCVGSDGPVASVLLVSERPISDWTRVFLDGVSRTSVLLARTLLRGPLAEKTAPGLVLEDVPPTTAVERASGTTAALVIGDAALNLPDRLKYRVDLGEEWTRWTGVPFVYAAWAGRPDLSAEVLADLRAAGARGVAAIPTDHEGRERAYLTQNIRFPLDDRALMGLRRFGALVNPDVDVQLFGPPSRVLARDAAIDRLLELAAAGEVLGEDEAVQLASGARLADLAVAADLRRKELFGQARVAWGAEARAAELVIGRSSARDRVKQLLAWRSDPPPAMRVVAAEVPGPVGSTDNTAEDHLRWQAIARLLGPPVPLHAAAATEGVGMSQLSLRMGVDTWGDPGVDPEIVVHGIREAGFTPVAT
jgi:chorismate dehydratase